MVVVSVVGCCVANNLIIFRMQLSMFNGVL